jgi:hypothetical protein
MTIRCSNQETQSKQHCQLHGIILLTTMDILLQAYTSGIMDEAECDE